MLSPVVDACMMAFEKSLSSRGFLDQSDDSNFPLVVQLFFKVECLVCGVQHSAVPCSRCMHDGI